MDNKGIFIAGSNMNAGKTTLGLGLVSWLEEQLPGGVSFMKPMGQKTMLTDGGSVGEDTFLINTSLGLDIPAEYTAPFTMSSGAAQKYLSEGKPPDLERSIRKAFRYLRARTGMVVVEGTGHPGVGSVFDLCNARVAGIMGIPVLLVLDGGIGRTIDSFTLCSSLFRERSVPLLGVVINRVLESKVDKVRENLDQWFARQGVPVFGYIPFLNSLARPSIGMLGRELGFSAGGGSGNGSGTRTEGFIAGFGSTREILGEIAGNPRRALLLSSGREEVLDAILSRKLSGSLPEGPGAVVLCGDPSLGDPAAADGCLKLGIPLYRTSRNAEDSVSILNRKVFKVEPGESVKIGEIVRTVRDNVDLEGIMEALRTPRRAGGGDDERPVSRFRSWLSRVFGGR